VRRYGDTSTTTPIPGQNVGLKLTLQPVAEATPCQPTPNGLLWFSDVSGDFTERSEAAYLLPEGAPGPVLGVARVLGETCGAVDWSYPWTPNAGSGGAPGVVKNGATLIVYALPDTLPGLLEVSATCAGQSFGPILLTLLRYHGGGYGYTACPPPANNLGGWLRVPDNFLYVNATGTIAQYGGPDGAILIGANQVTTLHFDALPAAVELFVYANDGGSGYFVVNNDAVQRLPQRGMFLPPWTAGNTPTVALQGLTALELHSDGYNAPFYVFIR
jgi:hypothetical protein